MSLNLPYVHYDMLTYASRVPKFDHEKAINRVRQLHATATHNHEAIEQTSSVVHELVTAEQQFLRSGLSLLAPDVTTLEAVNDPGSIEDITQNLHGSFEHMEKQFDRLGRSTIYRLCQLVDQVRLPLEKLLVVIRGWQDDEDRAWLNVDPESLTSRRKVDQLIDADTGLNTLISRQKEQLRQMRDEFALMASGIDTDERMLKLYEQGTKSHQAVRKVKEELDLSDDVSDNDAAIQEAMEQGLVTAIDRKVSRHRPSIIPLIEKVEGIASHESSGIVLDFLERILREKDKIDNKIAAAERKPSS